MASTINVQITWESTDVTSTVTSYTRVQNICDGVGTFTFNVPLEGSPSYDTWDTVELREDGILKGTFFISNITDSIPSGTLTIDCQDKSKHLTDYFVADLYTLPKKDTYVYTKTWIINILLEAKVTNYQFTSSGNGTRMTPESTVGMDTAYNIIQTLLQQSGWHMYFDENGKAIIGKINQGKTPVEIFYETDILEISRNKNDNILRNRAVVWGAYNSQFSSWVTAEASKRTPWQIDSNDERTVLVSIPYIYSYTTAGGLASTLLNEFSVVEDTKEIAIHGARDITIGETIGTRGNDVYNGNGTITTISSELSSNGLITRITLDERCPRLFALFENNNGDTYVYIGTREHGVWRKPLNSDTWEDYSTGLDDFNIIDLFIKNGRLVAVGGGGFAYTRVVGDSSWSKIYHGQFAYKETTYEQSEVEAVACSISDSNEIKIAYNHKVELYSWLYTTSNGTSGTKESITVKARDKIRVLDIEAGYPDMLVTTGASGIITWTGGNTFPYNCEHTNQLLGYSLSTPTNAEKTAYLPPPPATGIRCLRGQHYKLGDVFIEVMATQQWDGDQPYWFSSSKQSLRRNTPIDTTMSGFSIDQWGWTGYLNEPSYYYLDFDTNTAHIIQISWGVEPITGIHAEIDMTTGTSSTNNITVTGNDPFEPFSDPPESATAVSYPQFAGSSGKYFYLPVRSLYRNQDPSDFWTWYVGYYKVDMTTGIAEPKVFDTMGGAEIAIRGFYILGGSPTAYDDYAILYLKTIIDNGWNGSVYSQTAFHRSIKIQSQSIESEQIIVEKEDILGTYLYQSGPNVNGVAYVTCTTNPMLCWYGEVTTRTDVSDYSYTNFTTNQYGGIKQLDDTDRLSDSIDLTDIQPTNNVVPRVFAVCSNTADTATITLYNANTTNVVVVNTIDLDDVDTGAGEFCTNIAIVPDTNPIDDILYIGVVIDTGPTYAFYLMGLNLADLSIYVIYPLRRSTTIPDDTEIYVGGNTLVWRKANGDPYGTYSSDNFIDYDIKYIHVGDGSVLRHSGQDLFQVVHSGQYQKVEISQGSPTAVYNINGDLPGNQQLRSRLAISWSNVSGSFFEMPYTPLLASGGQEVSVPIRDLRVFSLGEYTQTDTYSGLSKYIGVASSGSFNKIPADLSGNWTPVQSGFAGGAVRLIETANKAERPFMFVVTSGDGRRRFYQADENSVIWNENSVALPSGMIHIIRVDDRI